MIQKTWRDDDKNEARNDKEIFDAVREWAGGRQKVGCCDDNPVGLWRGLDKRFHQNLASWPMGIVAILSKPVVMAFRDVDPLPTARLCRKTRLGICDTR